MFTRRIQIGCLVSVALVLAAWFFRPGNPRVGHSDSMSGLRSAPPSNSESAGSGDSPFPDAGFRPAFQPTGPVAGSASGRPHAISRCFAAPDLTGRPHPISNRTEWVEWQKAVPFSVLLGEEELQRILSDKLTAEIDQRIRTAREEDLRNGRNIELWEWQDRMKSNSASLLLQQSVEEVVQLLGDPAEIRRYQCRLEGTILVIEHTVSNLSLDELKSLSEPYSLHFQPEGWDRMGPRHNNLRELEIDFTADGRVFQWSFNPLPGSPDW